MSSFATPRFTLVTKRRRPSPHTCTVALDTSTAAESIPGHTKATRRCERDGRRKYGDFGIGWGKAAYPSAGKGEGWVPGCETGDGDGGWGVGCAMGAMTMVWNLGCALS